MIEHFGDDNKTIAYILYLIMAAGKVEKIEVHKIFVPGSYTINMGKLQYLTTYELPSKLASPSRVESFDAKGLICKDFLTSIVPGSQVVFGKSVGGPWKNS